VPPPAPAAPSGRELPIRVARQEDETGIDTQLRELVGVEQQQGGGEAGRGLAQQGRHELVGLDRRIRRQQVGDDRMRQLLEVQRARRLPCSISAVRAGRCRHPASRCA